MAHWTSWSNSPGEVGPKYQKTQGRCMSLYMSTCELHLKAVPAAGQGLEMFIELEGLGMLPSTKGRVRSAGHMQLQSLQASPTLPALLAVALCWPGGLGMPIWLFKRSLQALLARRLCPWLQACITLSCQLLVKCLADSEQICPLWSVCCNLFQVQCCLLTHFEEPVYVVCVICTLHDRICVMTDDVSFAKTGLFVCSCPQANLQ